VKGTKRHRRSARVRLATARCSSHAELQYAKISIEQVASYGSRLKPARQAAACGNGNVESTDIQRPRNGKHAANRNCVARDRGRCSYAKEAARSAVAGCRSYVLRQCPN